MGLMSTRDFENYSDLFDLMMSLVNPPDLLIYLRSSIPNLIAQIQKRGREYERSIRIDYITGLNQRYEDWIKDYKSRLLIIDVDTIKFENRPEDFQTITDKIDAELPNKQRSFNIFRFGLPNRFFYVVPPRFLQKDLAGSKKPSIFAV